MNYTHFLGVLRWNSGVLKQTEATITTEKHDSYVTPPLFFVVKMETLNVFKMRQ